MVLFLVVAPILLQYSYCTVYIFKQGDTALLCCVTYRFVVIRLMSQWSVHINSYVYSEAENTTLHFNYERFQTLKKLKTAGPVFYNHRALRQLLKHGGRQARCLPPLFNNIIIYLSINKNNK